MIEPIDPLAHVRKAAEDYRTHDHKPGLGEDIYCLNLTAWMGERMGAVLKHFDAEVASLTTERDRLRKSFEDTLQDHDEAVKARDEARNALRTLGAQSRHITSAGD